MRTGVFYVSYCIYDVFVLSLQRDLVPGVTALGEKGTGWESRTDGAAVCPLWNYPHWTTLQSPDGKGAAWEGIVQKR